MEYGTACGPGKPIPPPATDPRQTLIDEMTKLAEACDVGKAFDEDILDAKRHEAQAINRAGIRRQIEFIVSTYPPGLTEQAIDKIEGTILDNAKRGQTVACNLCGGVEFEAKAKIKALEGEASYSLDGKTFSPVKSGGEIPAGAIVKTGPNARLELGLPDGSFLRMSGNSQMKLNAVEYQQDRKSTRLNSSHDV
jgi:hypothetical protein